jgi:hypothetical protein
MLQGSLEPALVVTLTDGAGDPVPLSEATSIHVRGELQSEQAFLRDVGSASDNGVVTMNWEAGDTDEAGRLWIDVRVVWTGNRPQWFRAAEVVDIDPLS